jgi:hypothetical protein
MKAKIGRPSKLTPQTVASLALAIKNGSTIEDACLVAGIDRKSFWTWRERAEKGEKEFAEFLHIIKKAELEDKTWHISNIRTHAARSWQASAWYLERRWPSEYGRREAIDPNYGQDAGAVKLIIEDGTIEEPEEEKPKKKVAPTGEGEDVGQ